MAELKLTAILLVIGLQIEFIASIGDYTLVETSLVKNGNGTTNKCSLASGSIVCDFQHNQGVNLHSGESANVSIENAAGVKFDHAYSATFNNIRIANSKEITADKCCRRENPYRLFLENSTGILINDAEISYLKAVNSTIKDLRLSSVDEFDIENTKIESFEANANKNLSSTIIGSDITNLNLTISELSWLRISDTKIDTIVKMVIKKTANISGATINNIPSNAITIEKESTLTMENVVLGRLASNSISVHGSLRLINVTYLKGYALDWVSLKSGGSQTTTQLLEGNGSTALNYTIINYASEFKPFAMIDVPKSYKMAIMLGVFLGLALLCCLAIIFLLKFSGKKLPLMKINKQEKIDKQEFSKLEEKDSTRNAPKNLYEIGNQMFPDPSKTVVNGFDPEYPPEYTDLDGQDDQVNYSELDKNNSDDGDDSSAIKINIVGTAAMGKIVNKPIIPPKVPTALPSQKAFKPKPAVPKREFPQSNAATTVPNNSFLQKITPQLNQAPPPPSITSSVGRKKFQLPTLNKPAPTTARKHSRDDGEPYESQEEYDVPEDDD